MILETVRVITAALGSNTYGVNYFLPLLSIDPGDVNYTPPSIQTVVDETVDAETALGFVTSPRPALMVSLFQPVNLDPLPSPLETMRDGHIQVMIRYAADSTNTAHGKRDAYYTFRAVEQCLRQLILPVNINDRTRNNIQVTHLDTLAIHPLFKTEKDTLLTGAMLSEWTAWELTP